MNAEEINKIIARYRVSKNLTTTDSPPLAYENDYSDDCYGENILYHIWKDSLEELILEVYSLGCADGIKEQKERELISQENDIESGASNFYPFAIME